MPHHKHFPCTTHFHNYHLHPFLYLVISHSHEHFIAYSIFLFKNLTCNTLSDSHDKTQTPQKYRGLPPSPCQWWPPASTGVPPHAFHILTHIDINQRHFGECLHTWNRSTLTISQGILSHNMGQWTPLSDVVKSLRIQLHLPNMHHSVPIICLASSSVEGARTWDWHVQGQHIL